MGMARLRVVALGALGFEYDGEPLAGLSYAKVRALLLALGLAHGRRMTRAALCALLWPNSDERAARTNLSQSLSHLRKALKVAGDDALIADTESVALNQALTLAIDADVFEQLIDDAERHDHRHWRTCAACHTRLSDAMRLYQGDFLADFSLPDSAPFDDWTLTLRERLRQKAASALERLIAFAEWRGDLTSAVDHARRQVALDPLNEVSQRELMRVLAVSDQFSAARGQFEQLRATLIREIGVEPEPETRRMLEQLNPVDARRLSAPRAPDSPLPVPADAMRGRDQALATLVARARDGERIITISGAPGVGKTRLAQALADALRFDYAHGVRFVELARLRSADAVLPAIGDALGLKADTPRDIAAQLRSRHMLLVLDNFEHVLDAAPDIADLITSAPDLTIITTTRAPLRVRSEWVFALGPLTQSAAVAVFVERAARYRRDFAPDDDALATIGAICTTLECLPLAIELVAARVDVASLDELQAQVASHAVDVEGPRDLPERQRTLDAAIDWSARLLSPSQRALLAELCVFAGGFDRDAVECVCAPNPGDLAELLRGSLLVEVDAERWRLLEPVRQYGESILEADGRCDDVSLRHAAYFSARVEALDPHLRSTEAPGWMRRLDLDHPNLQAAARWSLRVGRSDLVMRIGRGLSRFWYRRGLWREGYALLTAALLLDAPASDVERAEASRAAGSFAQLMGRHAEADRLLGDALALAARAGDAHLRASTLHNIGMLREDEGRFDEALHEYDRSEIGRHESTLKFPWQSKADALLRLGRDDEAQALYEKALALNRRLRDDEGYAHVMRGLSKIACRAGDLVLAERLARENELICARLDHMRGLTLGAQLYGDIALGRGAFDIARAHYEEAMALMDSMGDRIGRCSVLAALGAVAVAAGEPARALALLREAQDGWRALNIRLTEHEAASVRAAMSRCAAAADV